MPPRTERVVTYYNHPDIQAAYQRWGSHHYCWIDQPELVPHTAEPEDVAELVKTGHQRMIAEMVQRLVTAHQLTINSTKTELGQAPLGVVADLGCGTGSMTRALAAEADQVLSFNISSSQLPLVPRIPGKADTIQADFTYLPLPSNSLDTALFFETLNHAAHPEFVLRNLRHHLRPNGVVLIADPFVTSSELTTTQKASLQAAEQGMSLTLNSIDFLVDILTNLNFSVKVENVTPWVGPSTRLTANSARAHGTEAQHDPILRGHRQAAIALDELMSQGVLQYCFLTCHAH
jgi:2-polyprenyl-3-methyl-5-hydroxy-6-metoxy-1,4-benzoquinol methylase